MKYSRERERGKNKKYFVEKRNTGFVLYHRGDEQLRSGAGSMKKILYETTIAFSIILFVRSDFLPPFLPWC
jgi:hypothetical protein